MFVVCCCCRKAILRNNLNLDKNSWKAKIEERLRRKAACMSQIEVVPTFFDIFSGKTTQLAECRFSSLENSSRCEEALKVFVFQDPAIVVADYRIHAIPLVCPCAILRKIASNPSTVFSSCFHELDKV
jgi:hypothetical protein